MAATATRRTLSDEQLSELLHLLEGADSVELKLTVPETDAYSTAAALGRRAVSRAGSG